MPKEIKTKIPNVSNAYSLAIMKRLRGIKLYNIINQLYVIINRDVIFDESNFFIGETMVSRLDYGVKQMVLN